MTINVPIDEDLLGQAKKIAGEMEASEVVRKALQEFVSRHRRPLDGMMELAGTNPLRDDYDYKALRESRVDDRDR